MIKIPMIKIAMMVIGGILACFLIAVIATQFVPVAKTYKVTLASYSHNAEFKPTAHSASPFFTGQAGQPNPVLFSQIISYMEMYFACSGFEAGQTGIKVVLEDKAGNWQKEIPVMVTGSANVSFPLYLDEFLLYGNDTNEQLGFRGGSYLLKITAEVPTDSGPFTATLVGELDATTLKWGEDGFNKVERGFPGEDDWRQGAFGYKAMLRENLLFGPITLERDPELLKTAVVGSEYSLFTELVESLDIDFNYRFKCNIPTTSLKEEAAVDMMVAEPGRWKKSFTLVPPTEKKGDFTISLPMDIGKLKEMAGSIDQEIGGREAKEQDITISARVHTIARTSQGTIDEVLRQQLKGKIGENIDLGGGEGGSGNLTMVREGAITKQVTEQNMVSQNWSVQKLRMFFLIGLLIIFLGFFTLAFFYWTGRPRVPLPEKELKKNRKKYGELISEVYRFPDAGEEVVVIPVASLEALVNISNNSLKPILLEVMSDRHTYRVIDGQITYQYASEFEPPDDEE